MTSKVPKGLATWAGVIAAAGQYACAVAVFLAADDQALAIAPLVTATGVLWKVIEGRMAQAQTLAEVDAALTPGALRPDYDTLRELAQPTFYQPFPEDNEPEGCSSTFEDRDVSK